MPCSDALSNPFDSNLTVSKKPFLYNFILKNVITDTHYDNPDRKGRRVTFMARILTDFAIPAKGNACNEYTSVCIDEKGITRIFGNYPSKDGVAYFIQPNTDIPNNKPEICSTNKLLEWNLNKKAITVYEVKGTNDGKNTFNLNIWTEGIGGVWKNWYVENGKLVESIVP